MTQPRVWQIASGDAGRNYSWLFRQHDLMFLGPGQYGRYEEKEYAHVVARGEYTAQKIGTVRSFFEAVMPGDVILLRAGHQVVEIGLAAAEEDGSNGYVHDEQLDDVYGWDLQHTRRVIWQDHLRARLKAIQRGTSGLFGSRKLIPTFTRVEDRRIRDLVDPLIPKCAERPLKPRPDGIPRPLTMEQLGQELFAKGLANDAVDNVLQAIERQRRLLRWYYAQGVESKRPDEHEVVAHMVLPLLLALGWSEQLLAIEWQKVDLAAFWGTPTTAERCVLVCEAKQMGHGLQTVWKQAIEYVKDRKLGFCEKILLTQGARFYLYQKPSQDWPKEQPNVAGYVNLERIRENHITPPNAIDTLVALTPAGVQRPLGRGS